MCKLYILSEHSSKESAEVTHTVIADELLTDVSLLGFRRRMPFFGRPCMPTPPSSWSVSSLRSLRCRWPGLWMWGFTHNCWLDGIVVLWFTSPSVFMALTGIQTLQISWMPCSLQTEYLETKSKMSVFKMMNTLWKSLISTVQIVLWYKFLFCL